MEWLNVTAESGLWGLLAASFLSATVLPGGSEALLWGFLRLHPNEYGAALALTTLGQSGPVTGMGTADRRCLVFRCRLVASALATLLPVHGARQICALLASGADGTAKLNVLPVEAVYPVPRVASQYAKIHFLTDPRLLP